MQWWIFLAIVFSPLVLFYLVFFWKHTHTHTHAQTEKRKTHCRGINIGLMLIKQQHFSCMHRCFLFPHLHNRCDQNLIKMCFTVFSELPVEGYVVAINCKKRSFHSLHCFLCAGVQHEGSIIQLRSSFSRHQNFFMQYTRPDIAHLIWLVSVSYLLHKVVINLSQVLYDSEGVITAHVTHDNSFQCKITFWFLSLHSYIITFTKRGSCTVS